MANKIKIYLSLIGQLIDLLVELMAIFIVVHGLFDGNWGEVTAGLIYLVWAAVKRLQDRPIINRVENTVDLGSKEMFEALVTMFRDAGYKVIVPKNGKRNTRRM